MGCKMFRWLKVFHVVAAAGYARRPWHGWPNAVRSAVTHPFRADVSSSVLFLLVERPLLPGMPAVAVG